MRLGRDEILLILALIVSLFAAKLLYGRPGEVGEQSAKSNKNFFILWIAQGFGAGGIPFAPGTFGSLVGLLWFAVLLSGGSFWFLAAGTIAGLGLSVWVCGAAEKILKKKDPGSVVLDEVSAMPICFFGWVAISASRNTVMPGWETFFSLRNWPMTLGVFVAFRFFDILKPWPVRQSQGLPGGWGVTIDDVLAAAYVNAVVLLVYACKGLSHQ